MFQKDFKVFYMTISKHLVIYDYKKTLFRAILILTNIYKQKHIE